MAYTAQDIIGISSAGGGQDLYDMVRRGQLTEAEVRAALGSANVDAFLERTQQQAPVPTMLGAPNPAQEAPLFNLASSSSSAEPTYGNVAIPGNQGLQSANVAIPASQGTQSANTNYTPPPVTTGQTGTNPVLGRPGLTTNAPPPSSAPTVPTPNYNSTPQVTGGNAGGYLNSQVPGGTTANNNYAQYPTPIPTSPNYVEAAQQQGEANLNAAKGTVALSNPNTITPYGSQTYTLGPDGRPVQNQTLSPELQARYNDLNSILPSVTQNIREQTGKNIGSYDFSDVMDPNSVSYTGRQTGIGVQGQSAVAEALRQREAPRLQRQRQSAEADLIARGFNPGTEGYSARMDDVSRAENDFNLGLTALSGQEQSRLFGLESNLRSQEGQEFQSQFNNQTSNRGREINEQVLARSLPIQEYQQLVGAMTPQLPQFPGYTGAQVQANPIFDATTQQGLFDLGRYNTSIQGELGSRGINVGAGNANKAALSDIGGAAIGAMAVASDIRLKTDIKRVGTSDKGYPLYTWSWTDEGKAIAGDQIEFGVIAQEVALTDPSAVIIGDDGYMRVDYRRVL